MCASCQVRSKFMTYHWEAMTWKFSFNKYIFVHSKFCKHWSARNYRTQQQCDDRKVWGKILVIISEFASKISAVCFFWFWMFHTLIGRVVLAHFIWIGHLVHFKLKWWLEHKRIFTYLGTCQVTGMFNILVR